MKKIDFSDIVVKDIEGNAYRVPMKNSKETVPFDFAKSLGNALFYQSQDLHLTELGQKIYHHEAVELSDEDVASVRQFINDSFVPFIRLSVNPQLDELLK